MVNSWSGSITKNACTRRSDTSRLPSLKAVRRNAPPSSPPGQRGLCPCDPGFNAVGQEWMFWMGAADAAPSIPAAESALRSHPCGALSSAQVLPEWTISTPPCNDFSANGDYPLNFVSRKTDHFKATGNPQLMLDSPGTGFTSRSYKPAPPVFLSRNLCSVPLIEAPLGPPDLFAARVFKPGEVETIPGAPLPAPPCK